MNGAAQDVRNVPYLAALRACAHFLYAITAHYDSC